MDLNLGPTAAAPPECVSRRWSFPVQVCYLAVQLSVCLQRHGTSLRAYLCVSVCVQTDGVPGGPALALVCMLVYICVYLCLHAVYAGRQYARRACSACGVCVPVCICVHVCVYLCVCAACVCRQTVRQEGLLSLWRGLEPTLLRDVPFSGQRAQPVTSESVAPPVSLCSGAAPVHLLPHALSYPSHALCLLLTPVTPSACC